MTQSPLDATLAAAAAEAQADTTQTAQAINQVDHGSVVSTDNTPAVSNQQVAVAPTTGTSLTMHSSVVQAQSSITDFFKLTDGGCSVADVKYDPIKVLLRMADAQEGGGFKPAYMLNFEAPSGMVYTKSYDGVTTVSNNPAHSGLSWAENVAKIKALAPNAFAYLGYDVAFVVAEDTASKDGKTTLKAGTVLGFTTPYLASKQLKKVWDNAVSSNALGKDSVLTLSGEEISKNGKNFKQLVIVENGYAAPRSFAPVDDAQ